MANELISVNMNLPIPVVGTDPSPQWASDINSCLAIVDIHNHTSGFGVQIPPSGLNINSDLTFQINNATNLRSARFSSQISPLSLPADLGCLYVSGVDLYYNDENGNQIRITQAGGVAGTSGSISNLTPPASASYVSANQTFVWQSGVNIAANMDAASLIIRYPGSYPSVSGNAIVLEAPASLATQFAIVLPASLPSDTEVLTLTPAGNIVPKSFTSPAISSSCGLFSTTSQTPVAVTNLSVTITTSGGPVMVFLQSDSSGSENEINTIAPSSGGGESDIFIYRDATQLTDYRLGTSFTASTTFTVSVPSSAISFMDTPGAGTYTYSVKANSSDPTIETDVFNSVLVAYEMF